MSNPASESELQPGDIVRRNDGGLAVILRSGTRPLALRAHDAEPTEASLEIAPAEMEGRAAALHVAFEETVVLDPPHDRRGRIQPRAMARVLRRRIGVDVAAFTALQHAPQRFVAGQSAIPYAGRVFDEHEVRAAVDASLDFWLTLGPHGDRFQRALAAVLGVRSSILVNSGSSANLCAFAALTSPRLGARRIQPGDEVITAAAGFPTTVNPILQHGAVPVFVDSDPSTGNLDVSLLEAARSPRTRAVMVAHALGNPVEIDAVVEFCRRHDLWFIEDNCDALGSTWKGKPTGTFGDLSTQSFYPPHHLTMGEGGAVNVTRDVALKPIVESFRDWGRDCWCDSGKSDTCGKRFEWQLGELPLGYDHKYIYSHLGYNLKPLDIQAAIGNEQLRKLPAFTAARRRNWNRLRAGVAALEEFFLLPRPTPGSDPSWFGFLLVVAPTAPFRRADAVRFLEDRKIQTRMLFGGNLVRQPAYRDLPTGAYRIAGALTGADRLMNDAFFIGVYPGLGEPEIDYMIESLHDLVKKRTA